MSTSKLTEMVVTGTVNICVPLEVPTSKKRMKELIAEYSLNSDATIEEIAKAIVLDAIRVGLDEMEYRQSCESSVDDCDLEVEIE